jgi:hypothetical protein
LHLHLQLKKLGCESTSSRVLQRDLGRAGQKIVPRRTPQNPFPFGPTQYGVRPPEFVPPTQGTLRARRTQRKARRGVTGPTRQRHTNGRSTVAYLATVQLSERGTVVMATASIDARTVRMERELHGRTTATLFDICAAFIRAQ